MQENAMTLQDLPHYTAADVERWLIRMLVETLNIPESAVDVRSSFQVYGLDSSALIGVSDALGEWLGRDLDPTLLYDNPNIYSLARAVARNEGER